MHGRGGPHALLLNGLDAGPMGRTGLGGPLTRRGVSGHPPREMKARAPGAARTRRAARLHAMMGHSGELGSAGTKAQMVFEEEMERRYLSGKGAPNGSGLPPASRTQVHAPEYAFATEAGDGGSRCSWAMNWASA